MRLSWWKQINRQTVRREVRRLIPNGGCTVFVGNERMGLSQAADIAKNKLASFDYYFHRVSRQDISTPQSLIHYAWKSIRGETDSNIIPREMLLANVSAHRKVSEICVEAERKDGKHAFIFEMTSQRSRIDKTDTLIFKKLSKMCSIPIVVTSILGDGIDVWSNFENVVRLDMFTREDILSAMLSADKLKVLSFQEIEDYVDDICSESTVYPQDAYEQAKSVEMELQNRECNEGIDVDREPE